MLACILGVLSRETVMAPLPVFASTPAKGEYG
jgi:hypothetical protein